MILLIIECVSLNLIASIIASQETSIRKFMIPTYPYNCSNLARSTNYTEKQFQFLAPLEDISSSISTKKKERIFPQWRTISRGGSRIAPANRPVIFSVAAPKRRARGEEFGSGTCMHRTGGTTRNVNSSLIEMPRKDSPFNRDPNDKFLFPRVISCPRIFVQIRVG